MKGRSFALIAAAVLICALALSLGCSTTDQSQAARQEIAWVPKKLAVMPFIRVDAPIQPGGTVCCPLDRRGLQHRPDHPRGENGYWTMPWS